MSTSRSPATSISESDPEILGEIIDEEDAKLDKLMIRVAKCKGRLHSAEKKLRRIKEADKEKKKARKEADEVEKLYQERKKIDEGKSGPAVKLTKSDSNKILRTAALSDAASSLGDAGGGAGSAGGIHQVADPSLSASEQVRVKKERDDKEIAEMQERQRERNQETLQRESAARSEGGQRALDKANERAAQIDHERLENERRFHDRESRRVDGAAPKSGMTKGESKGKGHDYKGGFKGMQRRLPPSRVAVQPQTTEVNATGLTPGMSEDDEIDIATIFDQGYRTRNPSVEQRLVHIAEKYRLDKLLLRDVYLHIYNPARGNFAYGWEDDAGQTHFLTKREDWHNVRDLQRGVEYYHMLPREAQKLHHTVDAFNGFDTASTSCLLIRRIGNPSFGIGYCNEEDWAPWILTCLGLFPFGNYAVVASSYKYYYPESRIANEACFIGEMRITLATRDLAELYMHVLSGEYFDEEVTINENKQPIKVLYSGYALTGKDMLSRVDSARVDKDIWTFPAQFDSSGRFITNGPGSTIQEPSPFII